MAVRIAALAAADHPRWLELAGGYKAFYKTAVTAAEYERAWRRLLAEDRVHGLGAQLDGRLVGISPRPDRSGSERRALAAGGKALLADAGSQRGGARALRQGRKVQRLHPL
jgi:hypothetical protein